MRRSALCRPTGTATVPSMTALPLRDRLPPAALLVAAGGPALLIVAALMPDLRPGIATAAIAGWVLLRFGGHATAVSRAAIAWAAVLLLAVVLTWPWVLGADAHIGDPSCRDPFSVIVVRRVIVAFVGFVLQALLPVHIAMLTSVGIAGGLARWRFGSLWIPIGIHVGADIALYVGLACRAAA